MRKRIKDDADKKSAATKIAASQRGKNDRRKIQTMKMEKRLAQDKQQTEAAIKIQAAQHGKRARKKADQLRIERDLGLTGSAEET